MTIHNVNWTELGRMARASADDAHGTENTPPFTVAWGFVCDNPECFFDGADELDWDSPAGWPDAAPVEFIHGYYMRLMEGK